MMASAGDNIRDGASVIPGMSGRSGWDDEN